MAGAITGGSCVITASSGLSGSLKSWGCSLFALLLSGLSSDGGASLTTPSCPPEIGCLVVMPVAAVALVLEAAAAAVVAAAQVVVLIVVA